MDIPDKILHNVQPSGLNSKFEFEHLNFSAYVSATKNILRTVNEKMKLKLSEEVIELNSPFEWYPAQKPKKGALLIHGLFDSPFMMRDVAKHLLAQGFLVRSILLTGHGTIPADLLTTSHKEWLKTTEYGVNSFSDEVEELYLVGFSTGASLSLNYVLQHQCDNPKVTALIMLSPAFALNTKKSVFVRMYRMFRWLFKDHKWVLRHECPDYTKYTSFPLNSGYFVQRLIIENKILQKNNTCPIPIFMAVSLDDETVRANASLKYFATTTNSKNSFVLYTNKNKIYQDSRIVTHKSAKADENILDFSHIAVPNSPDNAHYGRTGDHKEPLHEPKNSTGEEDVYYGASTAYNEENYRLRRLTYNPYFEKLMQQIDQFIELTSQ